MKLYLNVKYLKNNKHCQKLHLKLKIPTKLKSFSYIS